MHALPASQWSPKLWLEAMKVLAALLFLESMPGGVLALRFLVERFKSVHHDLEFQISSEDISRRAWREIS